MLSPWEAVHAENTLTKVTQRRKRMVRPTAPGHSPSSRGSQDRNSDSWHVASSQEQREALCPILASRWHQAATSDLSAPPGIRTQRKWCFNSLVCGP